MSRRNGIPLEVRQPRPRGLVRVGVGCLCRDAGNGGYKRIETVEIGNGVEACREPSVLDATVVEATKSRDLNR